MAPFTGVESFKKLRIQSDRLYKKDPTHDDVSIFIIDQPHHLLKLKRSAQENLS